MQQIVVPAAGLMFLLATSAVAQRSPPVHAGALSPDGGTLAESFAFAETPGVIQCRDVSTGKVRFVCKGHTDAVNAITFTADGKVLASADCTGAIRLWNAATGKALAAFAGTHKPWRPFSLAFSPDGKTLASSSPSRIVLWEVASGEQRAVIETEGKEFNRVGQHSGSSVVFSPNGRTLAYATDSGPVQLFDVATRRERMVLRGHERAVLGLAFTRDGRTLATGGMDETVRLWDVKTGRETATLRGHRGPVVSIVFSRDGSKVCSWCFWQRNVKPGRYNQLSGTELKVWDVETRTVRVTFEPDDPELNSVRPLFVTQFTRSGEDLLTVTADHHGVERLNLARLAAQK